MHRLHAALLPALGLLVGLLAVRPGFALDITPSGAPEIVFRWATDACDRQDYPDTAARAFRDATGTVHLFASHDRNRAMLGPDLNHVRRDCRVVFEGGHRDEPRMFDDRSWLKSFYTLDGRTVYALVHTEFQGHLRAPLCPSHRYLDCWNNAITWALSRDGGYSFTHPTPPAHLVAALPYPYRGDLGRHVGLFSASNIVRRGGYYYALVFAERYEAQRHGVCLMRTDRLDDPKSWRAWDGDAFTVRFIDPYREAASDPERHTCAPVGVGQLGAPVQSLVRHAPSGFYVALMNTERPSRPGAAPVTGIFAAVSRDLVTWSEPLLVLAAPLFGRFACDGGQPIGYPSLLDPDSASRNFDDVGDAAFLYFTRVNLEGCRLRANRDLVRVPVRIAAPLPDRHDR